MAATKAGLSSLLYAKLSASAPPSRAPELQAFCDDLADAIVTFLKTEVQVSITQALVNSGPGAGGAVTGTGVLL